MKVDDNVSFTNNEPNFDIMLAGSLSQHALLKTYTISRVGAIYLRALTKAAIAPSFLALVSVYSKRQVNVFLQGMLSLFNTVPAASFTSKTDTLN